MSSAYKLVIILYTFGTDKRVHRSISLLSELSLSATTRRLSFELLCGQDAHSLGVSYNNKKTLKIQIQHSVIIHPEAPNCLFTQRLPAGSGNSLSIGHIGK